MAGKDGNNDLDLNDAADKAMTFGKAGLQKIDAMSPRQAALAGVFVGYIASYVPAWFMLIGAAGGAYHFYNTATAENVETAKQSAGLWSFSLWKASNAATATSGTSNTAAAATIEQKKERTPKTGKGWWF